MPEFLDGVKQGTGGGNSSSTPLADVTISGGAVTTMTSSTIAPVEGTRYRFSAAIKCAVSTVFSLYINGDTTASNYRRGVSTSGGTTNDNSATAGVSSGAIGTTLHISGTFIVFNDTVVLEVTGVSENSVNRLSLYGLYHATATNLTELQITSTDAGGVDDDSNLRIWEDS